MLLPGDWDFVSSVPRGGIYNHYYYLVCKPVRTFAWRPQKCAISGVRIWLRYGLRFQLTGPTAVDHDPVIDIRWHDEQAHLFWKLKQ